MKQKYPLSQPCSVCGATRFGIVEELGMDFATPSKKGWDGSIYPRFDAVVCTGCGSTRFFLKAGKGNLLDECVHEIVDVGSSPSPYR